MAPYQPTDLRDTATAPLEYTGSYIYVRFPLRASSKSDLTKVMVSPISQDQRRKWRQIEAQKPKNKL